MKKTPSGIMVILLLTSTLIVAFNIQAAVSSEPPATEWTRTYGGANDEGGGTGYEGNSVVQTCDGGYAIAGYTSSFGAGNWDVYLVKTDWTGNMQWNKTYGGANDDYACSVVQTCDGGYAIAGATRSFGAGNWDSWLVKTDAVGNMQWNQTYGGTRGDSTYSIVQTYDNGYVLAGGVDSFGAGSSDFWLIKTDANGNVMWNRTYGGARDDDAFSVIQACDGGYALAGKTTSFNAGSDDDFWLVKTNSTGHEQWNKTYGGQDQEYAYSVVQTSDGGYALAGYTESFGAGLKDFWLVKTDSVGSMQWNGIYGDTNEDDANWVVQTEDEGYALTGATKSFGTGGWDFWLIKLAPVEIPSTVDIDPDTLNLKSNGQWITAYIELPEEYSVSEIDVFSILLNGSIGVDPEAPMAIGDHDTDSVPDLMAKFERAAVIALLGTHDYGEDTGKSVDVALVITGEAAGMPFEGVDTIRVLLKG